jgi:hypothetical protein
MAQIADKTISTPAGDAPLIPVLLMAGGAYLCWFGVHYWRSDTPWPTDPIKAVFQGKALPETDYSSYQAAAEGVTSGAKNSASGTAAGGGSASTGGGGGGGSTATGTLSYAEITQVWVKNGGSSTTANLAAAIAEAESSGRTGVTSSNPDGGTNVGLWQLDTKGVGAGYTVAQLQDPDTNARITVMHTSNGKNWGPWETWHTGAYKKYLQQGPVAPGSGG